MRIALYQGKSFISRLIRWQTRSRYSHAAFLLDNGNVIEAWTPCVREISPKSEIGNPKEIRSPKSGTRNSAPGTCNSKPQNRKLSALSRQHTPGTIVDIFSFVMRLSKDENRMLEFLARRDVGTPYDYLSILRFCTREKSSDRRHRLFCSEQVFARCEQIGRPLLDRTAAWRVPPDWIARSPRLELEETIVTG